MAIETTRPKLLLPGLRPPDPSLEIYRVRPGGATVVALNPDDRFTVIDRDGGQVAEVTALSSPPMTPASATGFIFERAPQRPQCSRSPRNTAWQTSQRLPCK